MQHNIKCWPVPFGEILAGHKVAEFRRNDRDFRTGDTLLIREWCPTDDVYTHRELTRRITHVLAEGYGLPTGYAMLSFAPPPEAERVEIPAGMKPWRGGDNAPADWDGGPVLFRDGKRGGLSANAPAWDPERVICDDNLVTAYTPRPATSDPAARHPVARMDALGVTEPVDLTPPGVAPWPTEEMLAAGVREMRVSTYADKGVALDVWNAMHRAAGIAGESGEVERARLSERTRALAEINEMAVGWMDIFPDPETALRSIAHTADEVLSPLAALRPPQPSQTGQEND